MDPVHPPLRTFGRIRSRAIKPRQAALMTTLLPTISVPEGPLDPRNLMPEASEVWLEIGFGGGEHMAALAARRPDVLILGAEPFLNGVASALRHIEAGGLNNVRLWTGDARDLMAAMPDASLGRLFILFPDPWPKARHVKRRLIQPAFAVEAARLMKPGGRVRFATDWAEYADQALVVFGRSPHFHWLARRADDWRRPPADHVATRYEEKRLGDCPPIWFEFEKL
ncbi:MAG: tRNA ((46)-N7)-methyltransferase TrmB [Caulobacteraceae bacterium]|nr:tRNA ((46)-N7)-methyltransferase TrmB [Caulobacteraceae bacterium]